MDREVERWHRELNVDGNAERVDPELEEPEAQPSQGLKRVDMPTPQEVRDHERTHLPFRSWCKHCVFGRAKNEPHRKVDNEDHRMPKLSWDYFYMSEKKRDGEKRPAVVIGEGLPMVVCKDSFSKGILAFAVPEKGVNKYAVSRGSLDTDRVFGYSRVIFKSDQEPALETLLDGIQQTTNRDQISRENSPVGESESNGDIENAVAKVQGMFRTLRSNLEANYGHKIPSDHPILTWMVRYASLLMFWYEKGSDGRTPHFRVKGKSSERS